MRDIKQKRLLRVALIVLLVPLLGYAFLEIVISYSNCPFGLRYELARSGYRLSFNSNRDGSYKSFWMNADGSQTIEVSQFPDDQPSTVSGQIEDAPLVSPDGQHVALEDSGLWITNREMVKEERLVHPAARVTGFSWSPDGRFLAIAEGVITVTDVAEQKTRSLSDVGYVGVDGIPRWSPDGKYIAFEIYPLRGRDAREAGLQNWEIYVLDVDTFQPCLLTTSETYSDRNPAWLTNH